MFKKITFSFTVLFIALLGLQQMTLISSCANIIPPGGGPKDSLAPVVKKMVPQASAVNVTSNKIVLEFDEYLQQFDNSRDNLLISPLPQKPPVIEVKLRTITVKLRDTLEPNTTYTVDFGNGIKDANEGNVLRDFRYVFSTGAAIDSLQLKGKVILAESGKIDSTLLVCLHRNLTDSAVYKELPRYYAKLNAAGEFTFRNLPAGKFNLFALQDEGGQKKYLTDKQLFAFLNEPVTTTEKNNNLVLYAYAGEPDEPKAAGASPTTGAEARLRVQSSLEAGMQDVLAPLVFEFNRPLKTIDTNKLRFADTLNRKLEGYTVIIDSTKKKITLQYPWKPDTDYRLLVQKDFASDEKGNTLPRNDTIKFRTKRLKDYGSVRIRIAQNQLPARPVLQIVEQGKIVKSVPVNGRQVDIALFKPGDYELRVLNDENRNGVWDPGNYFRKRKQPEKVTILPKKLNVRADWQNELDIE